jgi:hypothetical protein
MFLYQIKRSPYKSGPLTIRSANQQLWEMDHFSDDPPIINKNKRISQQK